MSLAALAGRELMARRVRTDGGNARVTLRRSHGLRATGSGLSLAVSGAHSSGASSLSMTASGLRGDVPAGVVLTVGATDYEVQAAALVEAGVLSVSIDPVLAGALSGGEAVTLSQTYGDAGYYVARDSLRLDQFEEYARANERVLRLAADGAVRAPRIGDLLTSTGERVRRVHEHGPVDGVAAGWNVVVGEAV